jgi:hypothetical protein
MNAAPDAVPAGTTVAELAAALRRDAEGYLPTVAAVELLIAHGHWLSRGPFRRCCVSWLPDDDEGPAVAAVEWSAVAALLAGQVADEPLFDTDSERGVLAVAASIAAGHPCDLGSVLLSCDAANVRRIADAVLNAGGA